MRADYINPFIEALSRTFSTMLDCPATRGGLRLKDRQESEHDISGVIGLSGQAAGTVVLNFSEGVALRAAGHMLMAEYESIDQDVQDAIGELTNMVAGAAKAQLEEYQLSISLPNVISGAGRAINFPSDVPALVVPFDTPWGPISMEVGLTDARVAAGV
jgi:chemotaxis protein CheX